MSTTAVKRAAAPAAEAETVLGAHAPKDADAAAAPAEHARPAQSYLIALKPVIILMAVLFLLLGVGLWHDTEFASLQTSAAAEASSTADVEFEQDAGVDQKLWLQAHPNWPLSPLTGVRIGAAAETISIVHSRVAPSRDISSEPQPSKRKLLSAGIAGISQHKLPSFGVLLMFHGCKNSESTWVTGPEEQRFISALHAAGWWVLALASAAADKSQQRGGPKGGGCWDSHTPANAQLNVDVKRTLVAVDWALDTFPALQSLPWAALGVSSGGTFAAHVAESLKKRVGLFALLPVVSGLPKGVMGAITAPRVPPQEWPVPPFTLFTPMKADMRSQQQVAAQADTLNKGLQAAGVPSPQDSLPPATVNVAPPFALSLRTLHAHLPAFPLPASAHLLGCLLDIGEGTGVSHAGAGGVKTEIVGPSMTAAQTFLSTFVKNYSPRRWLKPKAMRFILPPNGWGGGMPTAAAAYYAGMAPLVEHLWDADIAVTLRDDGRSEGPTSCAVAAVDAALMLASAEAWPLPREGLRKADIEPQTWPPSGKTVSQAIAQELAARNTAAAWIPAEAATAMTRVHNQLHKAEEPEQGRVRGPPTASNKDLTSANSIFLIGTPVGVRLSGVPVTPAFANATAPANGAQPAAAGAALRGAAGPAESRRSSPLPPGPPSLRQFRETVLGGAVEVLNAAFARHDMTSATVRDTVHWLQRARAAWSAQQAVHSAPGAAPGPAGGT